MLMTPPPPSYRSPASMNQQSAPMGGAPGVQNPGLMGNNTLGQEGMPRFDSLGGGGHSLFDSQEGLGMQAGSLGQGEVPGMSPMGGMHQPMGGMAQPMGEMHQPMGGMPQPQQPNMMAQALMGQMPPGMG